MRFKSYLLTKAALELIKHKKIVQNIVNYYEPFEHTIEIRNKSDFLMFRQKFGKTQNEELQKLK